MTIKTISAPSIRGVSSTVVPSPGLPPSWERGTRRNGEKRIVIPQARRMT